jgi:alkylhydroperoxidase family enzyme
LANELGEYMSAARVPLLTIEEAQSRAKEVGITEQMANLSVFRVLLQHPALAKRVCDLLISLLFTDNKLNPRLRELLIMRIGWATGAVYEWTQHWRVATQMDIPEADILAVRDWEHSDVLSEEDKAILQATDDVLQWGSISDKAWIACCQHLKTEAERVELVLAIGNWGLFSQLLKSLNIPLEDGIECWPPDGIVRGN